jgi:hypothetical protein
MPQSEARRIGLRTHLHDAAVACGRMPAGVCLRADDPAPQGGRCPYDLGYATVAVVGNDGPLPMSPAVPGMASRSC